MQIGRPVNVVYSSSKHVIGTIMAGAGAMLGILAIVAVIAVFNVLGGDSLAEWIMPVGVMAGMLSIAVIAIVAASLFARATETANIKRVLNGPHWAAWQYNPIEWQAYANQVRQAMDAQINRSPWALISMVLGLGLVLLIGVGVMAWLLFGIPPEARAVMLPMLVIVPIVLILTTIIIVVTSLRSHGQMQRMAAANHAAMLRVDSPRMYFTANGCYREDSGYVSLNHLTDAEYLAHHSPPAIRLKSWQQAGRVMYHSEMIIPVPRGSEQVAAALIERYRRERLGQ